MKNNRKLSTGENYNLSELFSGQRRIIIPDLQRDYCWGNDDIQKFDGHKGNLVSDFVQGLMEQFNQNPSEVLNLGLVYGYEVPADHIQICDGQQRLTTLYLLLGMINKKTAGFRQTLISDYEYNNDDKEPYLSYAIRESSLYFLSDLVCNFFTDKDSKAEDIKAQSWYFADYDLDPSITSMLCALKTIESILDTYQVKGSEWFLSFGTWLVQKVTFLYYDMGTRKNGEETFVVINTTGEPLSPTQNLKPLVISAEINSSVSNSDQMWEEIETWFWLNRDPEENDTSDAGFAEFLRWIYMIEKYEEPLPEKDRTSEVKDLIQLILQGKWQAVFPYKEIGIESIYRYWQALKFIFMYFRNSLKENEIEVKIKDKWLSPAYNNNVQGLKAISQNDCFVLLPMLKFVYENYDNLEIGIVEQEAILLNLRRLYEFLTNIMRLDNASRAVNTLVKDAIKIVDLIKAGDIIELLDLGINQKISSQILTSEELKKLKLLKNTSNREHLEKLFWKAQSTKLWNGQILPLIKFASVKEKEEDPQREFYENLFQEYEHMLDDKLIIEPLEHEQQALLLRRCFIVAAEKYEPVKRSSYYTFGWTWKDWFNLLSREENLQKINEFLDYVLKSQKFKSSDVEGALTDYIALYLDPNKNYSEFAKDNYLLSFTTSSSTCDMSYSNNDWQICTSGGTGRHTSFFSLCNARLLRELGGSVKNNSPQKAKTLVQNQNWIVWYWSASDLDNCVVVQKNNSNLKIDIRVHSSDPHVDLTLKKVDPNLNSVDIGDITSNIGLFKLNEGSSNEARYLVPLTQEVKEKEINQIILEITNAIDIFLANSSF